MPVDRESVDDGDTDMRIATHDQSSKRTDSEMWHFVRTAILVAVLIKTQK